VMHDDLSARDGRDDANQTRAPETPEAGQARPARARESGKLADREVPIELTRTPDLIHAWLDGELPEAGVRGTDAVRHVEFWKRLDRDLEVRRHAQAPTDLAERIMAALPATVPQVAAPWWTRSVEMNPVTVAAAAAGLLTIGAAIGATIKR
jgi:hypothetical protein